MDHSMFNLAYSNHLETTQVILPEYEDNQHNFNEFFNSNASKQTIDSTSFQGEAQFGTEKESTTAHFDFSDIPDDENDDFSWLFKVLPSHPEESYHTVPSGNSPLFEQPTQEITSKNEVAPLEQSMLLDPMLSEMDVTSLILHDEEVGVNSNEMTFFKADEEEEEEEGNKKALAEQRKKAVRRSSRATRPPPRLATIMLTETPVSLRRSQRKRSYQQMMAAEVKSVNARKEAVVHGKRQKMQQKPKLESTPINKEPPTGEIWTATETGTTGSELKMVFRRHKPVNPIDKKLVKHYNRGLIYSGKTLAAELYLKHTLAPRAIFNKQASSIIVENPLSIRKVEDLLRKEWIKNRNTIANAKAHGKETLGGKKLTSDGSAIQGTFLTIYYDQEYETLLSTQNCAASVIKLKEQFANERESKKLKLDRSMVNLENTFSNFSNFESYFHNENPEECDDSGSGNDGDISDDDNNDSMDTTLQNKTEALANTATTLVDNWPIFDFKGHVYRPNPAVVIIQRLPDQLIEDMKAKPKKITLESPYYSAMTSYFDNRLPA